MLRELRRVRQRPNEPHRRWFADAELELIVWLDASGAASGFQLCYDVRAKQHAVTLSSDGTWSHSRVDCGTGGYHRLAVLEPTDAPVPADLAARFWTASRRMDAELVDYVYGRLMEYLRG